jgi:hypothetical protein
MGFWIIVIAILPLFGAELGELNLSQIVDLNNTHGHISVSFDTLEKRFNVGGGVKIQFKPLYQKNGGRFVVEGRGSLRGEPSPTPFRVTPPTHSHLRSNATFDYFRKSGQIEGVGYELKIGSPYLRYKNGVVSGLLSRLELRKGAVRFLSVLNLALIQFQRQSYWLNRLELNGETGTIREEWYLEGKILFNGDWEARTGLQFTDKNLTSLHSGGELSISSDDQRLKYLLYLRYLPPYPILHEIGGELFGYTHTSPALYGYKFYITLQWELWKRVILALTPYLLFSKEYGFDPKIALYFFLDYRF